MIGQQAPEWKALAYVDGEQKEVSSKDYEGKWYVLFWYPLDFTFVCPTEIVGFQKLLDQFDDDGVAVIGCSTDSAFSHENWFKDTKTFPEGVHYPVLADTNHSVSEAFKVLKKDQGIAYRATVVVDDKGVIQSYAMNNLDVGRNPEETLRTVQACLAGGLCGANWHKGENFVA